MDVEDITECLGKKADLIPKKCEWCPVREKCWTMIHQATELKGNTN